MGFNFAWFIISTGMILDWGLEEVNLLHKSIVILPEDQEINTKVTEQSMTYEKGSPRKKTSSVLRPFLVIFCENDKNYYTNGDSAFQKIIKNLGLLHLNDYLFPVSNLNNFSTSFPKGIWIIGKPPKDISLPTNCLHTPNPDNLKTTEEKKELYQSVLAYSEKLKL